MPILHPLNWTLGFALILVGFVSGAILGLGFHRPDYLGGYGSFRRRIARLGHIAMVALGGLNILVSALVKQSDWSGAAMILFAAGGVAMPAVCLLSAWREPFRNLFFIPVSCLLAAVVFTLIGGP